MHERCTIIFKYSDSLYTDKVYATIQVEVKDDFVVSVNSSIVIDKAHYISEIFDRCSGTKLIQLGPNNHFNSFYPGQSFDSFCESLCDLIYIKPHSSTKIYFDVVKLPIMADSSTLKCNC